MLSSILNAAEQTALGFRPRRFCSILFYALYKIRLLQLITLRLCYATCIELYKSESVSTFFVSLRLYISRRLAHLLVLFSLYIYLHFHPLPVYIRTCFACLFPAEQIRFNNLMYVLRPNLFSRTDPKGWTVRAVIRLSCSIMPHT